MIQDKIVAKFQELHAKKVHLERKFCNAPTMEAFNLAHEELDSLERDIELLTYLAMK